MLIWFLIGLIFIAIVFAISIYIYDNGEFKKETNFSYFQVMLKTEIRNTYKLYNLLKDINKNGKVLLNVKLQNSHIDAICIQPSGIYVIEFKNLNGWLYGHEKAADWTVAMYKEKILKFQNPIIHNLKKILEVQNALAIKKSDIFHGLVVFSDNTVLKKVFVQSNNVNVINLKDLKAFMKKQNNQKLSEVEIEEIYKSLEQKIIFSKAQ